MHLTNVHYWACGKPSLFHDLKPFVGTAVLHVAFEDRHQRFKIIHPILVGREPWVFVQFDSAQNIKQAKPVALVRRPDIDPAVLCAKGLVGRVQRVG